MRKIGWIFFLTLFNYIPIKWAFDNFGVGSILLVLSFIAATMVVNISEVRNK